MEAVAKAPRTDLRRPLTNTPVPKFDNRSVYLQICRRLDTLINEASQDNTSARMAYDQCNIALQNCKETTAHYLHELQQADVQQRDYFLQASRQTLQTFRTLVHDAEVNVRNARPMPPFLY